MSLTPSSCVRCGRSIEADAPAVRAFARVLIAPDEDDVPDLRGDEALFHEACAPDWGDPNWISRAEGPLAELREP